MTMHDAATGGRSDVAPVTPDEPIEWRIALSGMWITLALGALFVAGGQWFMGFEGLLSTGMAVAIVVGMQLLTGAMMSVAARFGPTALMAAALAGYVFKLAIYALLIVLLRDVAALDGPSFAVTAAILLVVALAWQTRQVLRDQRLFWVVDADPRRAADATGGVVYTSGREPPRRPPAPRSTERTSA
jgi:hypothetical protein